SWIVEIETLERRRNADDRPGCLFRRRHGDGRGPIAKGRHAVIVVVDVPFRKNHERMRILAEDIDGHFEGCEVAGLAVDAEAAVPLKALLFEPLAHREDLPRSEEMERRADAMSRFDHYVRIEVERVVGRDHHA